MTLSQKLINFETLNSISSIEIKGIGSYSVRSMGHFKQTVLVNEIPFTLNLYVVPNRVIKFNAVLGDSLKQTADVIVGAMDK